MRTARTSLVLVGLVVLSACGGGGGTTAAATPTPTARAADGAANRAPGVSGLLAAVQGTTLQVQDASSQTAVTYSDSTTFTSTVPATASDVAVGLCAVVRSTAAPTAASASPAPARPTAVTAATVVLSSPVNGTCAGGAGGFGGGARPSGAPRVRPSGAPRGGFGGGAFGQVTAVSGSTFTVRSAGVARPGATAAATAAPVDVTVTTTPTTTWTKQEKATASALKTGLCVTARGPADSAGTVAATAISLRPATDGTCTSGFGGRNG